MEDYVHSKEDEMARWEKEFFKMQEPPDNILCSTCIYRLKPITVAGYVQDRSGYQQCDKYDFKPNEILWNNGGCAYYEKET